MTKGKKGTAKKFKKIIKICQQALKGKAKLEDTDLLDFLPILRSEIQMGRYDFTSIKAFSLSSHVLDLKTRNLLGEFASKDIKSKKFLFFKMDYEETAKSLLLHPINSFREFILENDIIKAYIELLKHRKNRSDYSISQKAEVCIQETDEFEEVDSFEHEKSILYLKLANSNKRVIDFSSLQNNWEDAVTNLVYLVHLAQEGRINLEQKFPKEKILIHVIN